MGVDDQLYQKNIPRRMLSKSRQIILMKRVEELGDLDTRLRFLSHIKHWILVALISLFMPNHVKYASRLRLQSIKCFMYYLMHKKGKDIYHVARNKVMLESVFENEDNPHNYIFSYKHNVYKHTEAQISKKLSIF